MSSQPKYFVIEAEALPDIFRKVVEAKRMLETGEASTVNRATAIMGISRSAFYKYKDTVRPFNDMLHGRIITVQIMLKDAPGILSSVLNIFAETGGNILTINQGIPVSGVAVVSIGTETSGLKILVEDLLGKLLCLNGVIRCETLAG